MNNTLIAIGSQSSTPRERAFTAAAWIGKITAIQAVPPLAAVNGSL